MNAILIKALAVFVVAGAVFAVTASRHLKTRSLASLLQLVGAGLWIVVALVHVCEGLGVFPWMDWGQEHSVGHYLDLGSALLGTCMLAIGFGLEIVARRRS